MPSLYNELSTHTSNEMEVAEAVKDKKELFSMDPQNSPLSPQLLNPKKPQEEFQELEVYDAEVFPQYPLRSQMGVANAQVLPAGALVPQGGCPVPEKIHKRQSAVVSNSFICSSLCNSLLRYFCALYFSSTYSRMRWLSSDGVVRFL